MFHFELSIIASSNLSLIYSAESNLLIPISVFFSFQTLCFHFWKSDLGLSHFLYLSLTCSFFPVFLNIWSIFIITVLMFLLIWASVSTDWLFSCYGHIFLLLCMQGNFFNWMPDIVKFTGLKAGYMYIHFVFPVNSAKTVFCDTVELFGNYLGKQFDPFGCCFEAYWAGSEQHVVESYLAPLNEAIYTPLAVLKPNSFLHSGCLDHDLFPDLGELQEFFFGSFWVVLSQSW